MKAVLISIRPEHIVNIAQLIKTIEMRRTAPLLKPPFTTYIYCTKPKDRWGKGVFVFYNDDLWLNVDENKVEMDCGCRYWAEGTNVKRLNGFIIGEFTCDKIECVKCEPDLPWSDPNRERERRICNESCLTFDQIAEYGKGSNLWGWHISDLKIYDKPKELSEFYKAGKDIYCNKCEHIALRFKPLSECDCFCNKYNENLVFYDAFLRCDSCIKNEASLTRPPQSWCYVEEL